VLAEFPIGDNAYDLRYMYFFAAHGRRTIAGFSGVFPDRYLAGQRSCSSSRWRHQTPPGRAGGRDACHRPRRRVAERYRRGIARWQKDRVAREAGVFDARAYSS
jgi:hypothetical protein